MLTTWTRSRPRVALGVGRPFGDRVDAVLEVALGVAQTDDDRTKPPCCDETGMPPVDPDRAASTADAVDHFSHRRKPS